MGTGVAGEPLAPRGAAGRDPGRARAGAALCRVAGSLRLNCRPLLLCSSPSWNGLQAAQGEDVLTGTGGSVRRRASLTGGRSERTLGHPLAGSFLGHREGAPIKADRRPLPKPPRFVSPAPKSRF